MALQAVAHLLCGECNLAVMACTTGLSFIVGLHGKVRRGSNFGLKRFVLAVAVQALLTLCQMRVVIEGHLPWTRVPRLILGLLLEGEGRWNLRFWLGEATRRRQAHKQQAREHKRRAPSDR